MLICALPFHLFTNPLTKETPTKQTVHQKRHPRHHHRTTRANLPNKHLRSILAGQVRSGPSQTWCIHHQHHERNRLPRFPELVGLLFYKGDPFIASEAKFCSCFAHQLTFHTKKRAQSSDSPALSLKILPQRESASTPWLPVPSGPLSSPRLATRRKQRVSVKRVSHSDVSVNLVGYLCLFHFISFRLISSRCLNCWLFLCTAEVGTSYVFLASNESSYFTGYVHAISVFRRGCNANYDTQRSGKSFIPTAGLSSTVDPYALSANAQKVSHKYAL